MCVHRYFIQSGRQLIILTYKPLSNSSRSVSNFLVLREDLHVTKGSKAFNIVLYIRSPFLKFHFPLCCQSSDRNYFMVSFISFSFSFSSFSWITLKRTLGALLLCLFQHHVIVYSSGSYGNSFYLSVLFALWHGKCFVCSGRWHVFSGNELGSLLGWWLWVQRKENSQQPGKVVFFPCFQGIVSAQIESQQTNQTVRDLSHIFTFSYSFTVYMT